MKEYAANDGPEAGTELATAARVLLGSPSVGVLIEHAPETPVGLFLGVSLGFAGL